MSAMSPPTPSPSALPEVLQTPADLVDFTFKLRDCPFVEFKLQLDRNESTVYDLMYSVAKHHGDTIEADKVEIFMRVSDDEFRPLMDLTKKLAEIEGLTCSSTASTPPTAASSSSPRTSDKARPRSPPTRVSFLWSARALVRAAIARNCRMSQSTAQIE